jgi:hypothetical protein
MWETPNAYPLYFSNEWFGGMATDLGQLVDRLDRYANMTCYIPSGMKGSNDKIMNMMMIKLTKCWDGYLSTAPKCGNTFIQQSNAICISRTKARSLYQAVEARSLIHQEAATAAAAAAAAAVTAS